ncbi:protein mono-ADP-ribosyltransferase PARP12 [Paralichthys olivaceus]|uniref:protein mono-ADP-ribosyltransferase PARP12 n=1 Tax=Paralichthys olivaceus TaxID=8255 RepID=UPI0037530F2B
MNSTISTFVIRTLCDHQGSLDSRRLNEKIVRSFPGVTSPVLRSVLFDDGRICIRSGREKATGGSTMSPDSLLVAKTSLRLCQRKPGDCPQCDGLHLCKYYVCGDCTFGLNPHSLASPYNADILKRFGLQDFTEKQLFQLLLQNDPYLLPEICPHYNRGHGEHGTCRFSTSCSKLHVCLHYIKGDCTFGSSCKRIHNIDAKGNKILRGLSQETINNLCEIYRNKYIIMGQLAAAVPVPAEVKMPTRSPSHSTSGSPPGPVCASKPTTDAERNEICLFFIRRHCSFKGKCVRIHWHLPYKWQVLDRDGKTWKDLPNMEDIEEAYCDPGQDASSTTQELSSGIFSLMGLRSSLSTVVRGVDFMRMTYEGSPVRRLSTASSVSKPPHFILTTRWLWYWKDEKGIWLEYGQGDQQASVTSETLENLYLAEGDTEIPFSAGNQHYVLHLGKPLMYQENLKYKTKREVRRRPCFVSAQDVKVKLDSTSSHSSSSSMDKIVPSYWDMKALSDFGFKHVLLSNSAKDHNMIEKLFRSTMPLSRINSIKRIQNPSLWKVFQWQKEQMTERNGRKPVNQQYLFHGTDASLIQAISEQNFDWRMCGVHGVAYGKGSYFARDASYSDRYACIKSTMNKIMFVALVLVGEYTKGSSSFVRPPPKANGRTFYDSCVDNVSSPSIYVIFEKQQIYPEYVIDYT